VLEADADIIGHMNGGHTALPYRQVCELCEKSTRGIELVHNGNERIAILAARHASELNCLHRVMLGTDGPAGSGVQPLGILRMIALLTSLADVPAEIAMCFATGNTARLRGLKQGLIEVGRPADFVFMDRAQHTAGKDLIESLQLGDLPGIGMVMIDGLVKCQRSRNTPPAIAVPEIR
jgi:enamidase